MNSYQFCGADKISTPALIYYKDFIEDNIHKTIAMAGGPERLWPHVKTHKMAEMVRLQMAAGINRFKCATIAEAEMAAGCGAADVLLAYPLAGPNIRRFFMLTELFSKVRFWAVGDDGSLLEELGALFYAVGRTANVLADVNPGLDRTGVALQDAAGFFMECGSIKGISMKGLHCYDGNRTEQDPAERRKQALLCEEAIKEVCEKLKDSGYSCEVLVLGGTPSLPCHADFAIPGTEIYLSPGTCLVNDYGYSQKFPDMEFMPGAAVLTRVVSHPRDGYFTLDLGYKGIASDPRETRGVIVGLEHVTELFQSEEHWTFSMEPGHEKERPQVGEELFVIPAHICPTTALYPAVTVVENARINGIWNVTARDRKITV